MDINRDRIECAILDIKTAKDLDPLSSATAEEALRKQIKTRVKWSGWKGMRDTRYRCPSCNKPVKNDDCYCHRCGQYLMFPHISHTPYVPGEEQKLIVTWEDEDD